MSSAESRNEILVGVIAKEDQAGQQHYNPNAHEPESAEAHPKDELFTGWDLAAGFGGAAALVCALTRESAARQAAGAVRQFWRRQVELPEPALIWERSVEEQTPEREAELRVWAALQ